MVLEGNDGYQTPGLPIPLPIFKSQKSLMEELSFYFVILHASLELITVLYW